MKKPRLAKVAVINKKSHLRMLQPNEEIFSGSASPNNLIGRVSSVDQSTDSAFVALANNVSVTKNSPTPSRVFERPLVGSVVTRISEGGQASSMVSSGRIVSTSQINYLEWAGIVQTMRATFNSSSGDSGGIVIHWASPDYLLAGIVIAKTDCGTLFVHAARINDAHDIQPL